MYCKTNFNKCKRTEVILNTFFSHGGMKLEINYMKKTGRLTNVEIKQVTNDQWVKEKIKRETKTPCDKWKRKWNIPKFMKCSKSSSEREVLSNKCLPQETRKVSNNLTVHPKELEVKRTNEAQS